MAIICETSKPVLYVYQYLYFTSLPSGILSSHPPRLRYTVRSRHVRNIFRCPSLRHRYRYLCPSLQTLPSSKPLRVDAYRHRLRRLVASGREHFESEMHRISGRASGRNRDCVDQHGLPHPGSVAVFKQRTCAGVHDIRTMLCTGKFRFCLHARAPTEIGILQGWGIIVGGAILQNGLRERLPSTLLSSLPQGTQLLTYSVIPLIPELSDQLQADIRVAFVESIRLIWKTMIGFATAGMVSSLLMREVPLRISMDETWGLKVGDHEVRGQT